MINNILLQQYNSATKWVNQTPVPKIIDTFTYDTYESSNPFRIDYFDKKPSDNKYVYATVHAVKNVGTEIFSAYTNPFYLTHKIVNIPTNYQKVVQAYGKNNN